ncbi:MAG: oxidoreductase [Fimbriimonadales bacterium]|nr:MAG: oxidoreductase [Fimbriimonadales bacterium]GIV07736.1 MAG: oxidoreductase [Fimbriimonadales bacterium]
METVGVGIIGAGGIAAAHAKAYQMLGAKAHLIGVADIDEERARTFARRYAVPVWSSEDEDLLKRDDIQIVSLCLPHHLHAPIAIAALQAGKHVLVEKPLAISMEEADAMIRAAQRAKRRLGVVFQLRFESDVQRAHQVLEHGLIGKPFYAEISCLWWRRPMYYENTWRGKWATEGGGAVINQAIHHIDLLRYLLGTPTRVYAEIDTIAHQIEVEDWCLATLYWEGMKASFCASTCAELEADSSRMLILGSHGSIQMFPFRPHSRQEERLLQIGEACRTVPEQEIPGHTAEIHDFVFSVLEQREPRVPATEGRHALELITAIYQSAFTGDAVELPLTSDSPCYTTAGKLEMARRFTANRAKRT